MSQARRPDGLPAPSRSLLLPLTVLTPPGPLDGPDAAAALRALMVLAERSLAAEEPSFVTTALLDWVYTTSEPARAAVLLGDQQLVVASASGRIGPRPRPGASTLVRRAHESRAAWSTHHMSAQDEPWLSTWLSPDTDVLVVPLREQSQRLGALIVQLSSEALAARGTLVEAGVELASRLVALSIHRLQRIAQFQRLAATDDLTKIANRRSFLASLERELARAARSSQSVSLVILDIDHFKRVNDAHGHPAGDDVLRNVAASLAIECRGFDIPARYGGEEFAVILPDCDAAQSVEIAARLRAAVAAAPAITPVTASAGVATYPAHAADGASLFAAADDALLLAKRSGRDRTVLAGHEPHAHTTGPTSP